MEVVHQDTACMEVAVGGEGLLDLANRWWRGRVGRWERLVGWAVHGKPAIKAGRVHPSVQRLKCRAALLAGKAYSQSRPGCLACLPGCPLACPPAHVDTTLACLPPPLAADQERFWDTSRGPFQFKSAQAMAHAFYTGTEAGRAMQLDLSVPFSGMGIAPDALPTHRWVRSHKRVTRALLSDAPSGC